MIKTVVSAELPIDEHLLIQKNRLEPQNPTGNVKRISVLTGIHGDELEGQLVCYELNRMIRNHMECLHGIVDIYPALNPLGIDSISRGIPMFELDMNSIFPGSEKGTMMESVAAKIVNDIAGSDVCIDIHASNIFLMEIPQVRISEATAEKLLPYANQLNVDLVWIHASATVQESTLAHSMNMLGVPTLAVEMGVGMRLSPRYCDQLLNGILNLMKVLGIWSGPVSDVRKPIVSKDRALGFVNSSSAGIFVPCISHGDTVQKGDHIGDIVNPLAGVVEERVEANISGMVFTLREYPVVYAGSLLVRILGGNLL